MKKRCFCWALLTAGCPEAITLKALLFRSRIWAIKASWNMADVIPGDMVIVVEGCFDTTMFCNKQFSQVIKFGTYCIGLQ